MTKEKRVLTLLMLSNVGIAKKLLKHTYWDYGRICIQRLIKKGHDIRTWVNDSWQKTYYIHKNDVYLEIFLVIAYVLISYVMIYLSYLFIVHVISKSM